jgi:hypothetical protein
MNVTADEIERIVRDVMSRLASERTAAAKPETDRKVEVATPANELVLEARVISLAEVQGRLSGMVRVSVAERAIVTPAVRDLLREKKVPLVRRAAGAKVAAATRTIVVAAAETKVELGGLVRDLRGTGCKVEQLAQAGLVAAVRELGEEVAKNGAIGLLVCEEPEAAVVALNRRSGVRAVGGEEAAAIERAANAVGANLYVVRGSRLGGMQVKRWLVPAAQRATSAPAKLAELLK